MLADTTMERAIAEKGDYVAADLAFHAAVLAAGSNQFVRAGSHVGHPAHQL